MKERQQTPTPIQIQRPVRYYIVKTEGDAQPVVRSVPVARPLTPVAPAASGPESSAAETDRGPRPGGRRPAVGRLARAAAAIRRPGR